MQSLCKKNCGSLALLAGLSFFFACDSRHTLIEAFLPNGEETKLFTYTSSYDYDLGRAVAIDNDAALVGRYLYRWDGASWTKQANLSATFYSRDFGVGLKGNTAVLGANVFRFNGASWQEDAVLTPSEGRTRYEFGSAISMSGEVIAVSDFDEYSSRANGAIHIFRFRGSWEVEAELFGATLGFGRSVSVDGNVVVAGAPGYWDRYVSASDTGRVYVYRYDGSQWQEEARLIANDPAPDDLFGRAVAVHGNVIVIGAPHDSSNAENAGAAYFFRYNGSNWREEAKLSFAEKSAYFGSAVAIEGNVAIIGAPFEEDDRYDSGESSVPGAAYVYRWDGRAWKEHKKLAASDGVSDNRFGAAVALNGRFGLIGAPGRNRDEGGAAYVYTID